MEKKFDVSVFKDDVASVVQLFVEHSGYSEETIVDLIRYFSKIYLDILNDVDFEKDLSIYEIQEEINNLTHLITSGNEFILVLGRRLGTDKESMRNYSVMSFYNTFHSDIYKLLVQKYTDLYFTKLLKSNHFGEYLSSNGNLN